MNILGSIAVAGAVVLAASAAGADSQGYPHIKPGLWKQDMAMQGHKMSDQVCVDEASEAKMSAFSEQLRNKNCQASRIAHNADGSWTSTATCTFGEGIKRSSRTVVVGDFDSKYTVTMHSPPDGPATMTMTAVRVGDCKVGMRGGDVVMSNGMKMNMNDIAARPSR